LLPLRLASFLHDALPIFPRAASSDGGHLRVRVASRGSASPPPHGWPRLGRPSSRPSASPDRFPRAASPPSGGPCHQVRALFRVRDRKSTRLNSSHGSISY